MNQKIYASTLALCTCLALGFQVGCGGSSHKTTTTPPPPTVAITATSGGGASATVSTAFAAPLVATVTSGGSPASGVSVTFTAPASGASGTFADGGTPAATDTETTDSSGVATSTVFTANATAGAYAVTATATGATASASFALTNNAATVVSTNNTYVYYASGEEAPNGQYYAVAGAVTLDSAGDIIGGEQDYNDGVGNTSPNEPAAPDTIVAAPGALVVDPTTGLGTLTMTSSNPNVGAAGVEIFAVQFVNANHALIMQFDGSATSSGSLDLQTATTTTGNFAFTASGLNPSIDSVDYGGVFTATSGGATGTIDINDADGGVLPTNAFTATTTTPDAYGRSVVTGISNAAYTLFSSTAAPINFVSYAVGPEAMRIIDVDTTDTAVGSAFGQGSGTFTDTSLANGVFMLLGQWSEQYGTLGQFTTDTSGDGLFATGMADDNELSNGIQVENEPLFGSSYDLEGSGINGYGNISLNFQTSAATVSSLGLYMTDPALNLNDPNNTTADLGGALIADMDADLPGGIGVVTPLGDTTVTDFNGSYAAGFQDFNYFTSCGGCEFDMVGPFTMDSTSGLLSTASIGADDSDPLITLTGLETITDTYSSTPLVVSAGYYSMSSANSTANPLAASLNAGATTQTFDVDIYQASATTLYWLNFGSGGIQETLFLGPIEQQPSGAVFPGTKKRTAKAQAKRK